MRTNEPLKLKPIDVCSAKRTAIFLAVILREIGINSALIKAPPVKDSADLVPVAYSWTVLNHCRDVTHRPETGAQEQVSYLP